jgi:hypothetical protein
MAGAVLDQASMRLLQDDGVQLGTKAEHCSFRPSYIEQYRVCETLVWSDSRLSKVEVAQLLTRTTLVMHNQRGRGVRLGCIPTCDQPNQEQKAEHT